MDSWLHDIRTAARSLRRAPGFSMLVVVMMALGIGVNAMIYTVVQGILFHRQPFPEPERIVTIDSWQGREDDLDELSGPDYLDLRERARSVSAMAVYNESMLYLTIGQDPERFQSAWASAGLLDVLGIQPILGRWFTEEECTEGRAYESVVLGHRIWKDRFGADPQILGRALRMNGRVRTVIGVLPEGMRFPEAAEMYIPIVVERYEQERDSHYLDTVARLAPGVTIAQAQAEFRTLGAQLEREHPETNRAKGFRPVVLSEALVRDIRPMMLMLSLAVLFVLLIACANIANLTLARATGRLRELGVRMALGAGKGRVIRQLLTESVLLGLVGGIGGVFVAQWGLQLTLHAIPIELPYWMTFEVDARVFAVTIALSIAAGMVAGLVPALQLGGSDLIGPLREGTSGGGDSPGRRRIRNSLVVSEIAIAVLMLIGSGLMVRTFMNLAAQRSGLDPRGVLTGQVTLPVAVYPAKGQKTAFFQEFRGALLELPGVRAAGAVANLHLGRSSWSSTVMTETGGQSEARAHPVSGNNVVTPGYLEAVGIRLIRGREFTTQDDSLSEPVAMVNESAARLLWPGEDAIGKRFKFGDKDSVWRSVVGITSSVRQHVARSRTDAEVLRPHTQVPNQTMTWAIRGDGDMATMASAVRRLLRERDPDLPFYESRSLEEHLRRALWEERLYAWLLGSFSALALAIAAIGIYGVMAYSVAQRTREIGIRMALGAAREEVQRMVVIQAMRLSAIGLGVGLAAAFALTRFMAGMLFGVRPDDPPTFIIVISILALSALVAAWVPAARATRVDPMIALRHE